jgi:hypothetical protein
VEGLDLQIDPLRLEVEWTKHPAIYGYWAEKLADAQAVLDEVKSKLDLVRATIDQEARENPGNFGIEKVTETSILNAVNLDPRMGTATKNLNEARKVVYLHKAAVDALEHKKRALTLLAELWVKEYYSELGMPKVENLTEDDKRALRRRGQARRERERDADQSD